MERNPDTMQGFYEGREVLEIVQIQLEMKEMLVKLEQDLIELMDKLPIEK